MGLMRFKEKTAVVTGGASGLGYASICRMVSEGLDTVIIVDINRLQSEKIVADLREQGVKAYYVKTDLVKYADIVEMAQQISCQVSAVDILINNAGIAIGGGDIEKSEPEDWEPGLSINLKAPFYVTQQLLPLLKQRGASVVNVSSDGATISRAGASLYDATKAGLISLSNTLAVALCKYNIRVNAIAPGWANTEFHFGHGSDAMVRKQQLQNMKITSCLMNRIGRAEEIAAAIAFLASDDSSYMTAATLCVDGGRSGVDLNFARLTEV